MKALVGQLAPGGRDYRARPVDLEGQPSWTLAQLWLMWQRKFLGDTFRMVEELLHRDWSVLANSEWPHPVAEASTAEWAFVSGVGRAWPMAETGMTHFGSLPAERPTEPAWAYLWEHGLEALHVYASHGGRWHHLATLPADVWAGLTTQLVIDVEARLSWLEREEAAA
ncbi:hypothetical protein [Micromonospora cathayae]|uniref:Uncharacterized protein n=1 Tax=Micromonospora cathayae TaxID=3028804 RepID=A0ABY7ZM93_9ACTN|nr:hypothetical protein [Micromonospora sp. HUAS 3]WDZ84017.1 hypothetical protein PVK37_26675 [Micromonospora sp. HUAS 3]